MRASGIGATGSAASKAAAFFVLPALPVLPVLDAGFASFFGHAASANINKQVNRITTSVARGGTSGPIFRLRDSPANSHAASAEHGELEGHRRVVREQIENVSAVGQLRRRRSLHLVHVSKPSPITTNQSSTSSAQRPVQRNPIWAPQRSSAAARQRVPLRCLASCDSTSSMRACAPCDAGSSFRAFVSVTLASTSAPIVMSPKASSTR